MSKYGDIIGEINNSEGCVISVASGVIKPSKFLDRDTSWISVFIKTKITLSRILLPKGGPQGLPIIIDIHRLSKFA